MPCVFDKMLNSCAHKVIISNMELNMEQDFLVQAHFKFTGIIIMTDAFNAPATFLL